jgi:hypothetical protein
MRTLWRALAALRFLVKVIAGGLAALVLSLVIGFVAYDVLYFQPQKPKIDQMIAAATEEERNPPEAVVRLVRADSHQRVASAAHWALVRDPADLRIARDP